MRMIYKYRRDASKRNYFKTKTEIVTDCVRIHEYQTHEKKAKCRTNYCIKVFWKFHLNDSFATVENVSPNKDFWAITSLFCESVKMTVEAVFVIIPMAIIVLISISSRKQLKIDFLHKVTWIDSQALFWDNFKRKDSSPSTAGICGLNSKTQESRLT